MSPFDLGKEVEVVEEAHTRTASSMILGYHKIRGLAAPLRMMFYYKEASFTHIGYASDMQEEWFGKDKPKLIKANACINLPYVIDGDTVVTQSNTCALYLGKKLGIDSEDFGAFIKNHTVLDQAMDLRNDLMNIVYPFAGKVVLPEEFPAGAKKHLESSAAGTFGKLEGYCLGPYMGGDAPQSGDFMLFEMLDQHASICKAVGVANVVDAYPKLKALHAKMKALPSLRAYFASDAYKAWAQNNGLFTHYTGLGPDFEYGNAVTTRVAFE